MTKEGLIVELAGAVESGVVYNPDFQRIKRELNYLFETEISDTIKAVYLSKPRGERSEADRDLYYSAPSSLYVLRSKKWAKALETSKSQLSTALAALVNRWGYAADLLQQAKPLVKKGRKPADNPCLGKMRTLDNTGTCACCGRNVKLSGQRIVDHGYTIPWAYGGRMGSCWGVHYLALEVSDEGLHAALRAYEGHLQRAEKHLAGISNGTVPVVGYSRINGARVEVALDDAHPNYKSAKQYMIQRVRADIKASGVRVNELRQDVATWKPTRLPYESGEAFRLRING